MTDEFYVCKSCGSFDPSTYTMLRVNIAPIKYIGMFESIVESKLEEGQEYIPEDINKLPVEVQEDLDLEEIYYCSECDNEFDGYLVTR